MCTVLQNLAAWGVAGVLAWQLFVVPERRAMQEQQVPTPAATLPLRAACAAAHDCLTCRLPGSAPGSTWQRRVCRRLTASDRPQTRKKQVSCGDTDRPETENGFQLYSREDREAVWPSIAVSMSSADSLTPEQNEHSCGWACER